MPGGKAYNWIRNAVVVIVCALVVAMVVVHAMDRAREAAEQQQCAENLKLLGEACAMYQSDWHDVLVPYGSPFAWTGHMWPELLWPYIRKLPGSAGLQNKLARVLVCPARPVEEECSMDASYGMNTECGGWMSGGRQVVVRLKAVKYPGKTIRIAEVQWFEAHGGTLFAARPSDFKPDDPNCHMFRILHRGNGNVLWIDGHVSAMTRAQYNMRDKGPYDGNIWLRLEGPKPPLP